MLLYVSNQAWQPCNWLNWYLGSYINVLWREDLVCALMSWQVTQSLGNTPVLCVCVFVLLWLCVCVFVFGASLTGRQVTQSLGNLDTPVLCVWRVCVFVCLCVCVCVFVFDASAEGAGGLHNLWETSTHQCFVSLSSSVTLFLHTSTTFFLNVMSHQCVQIYNLYGYCVHINTLDMCVVYKKYILNATWSAVVKLRFLRC